VFDTMPSTNSIVSMACRRKRKEGGEGEEGRRMEGGGDGEEGRRGERGRIDKKRLRKGVRCREGGGKKREGDETGVTKSVVDR
jgi:hypothetical protein